MVKPKERERERERDVGRFGKQLRPKGRERERELLSEEKDGIA